MPKSRSRRKRTRYTPPPQKVEKKTSPPWLVPTMVTLMIVGLLWIVVTYVMQGQYPIPGIGNGNLAIGFALLLAGFGLTTQWH